MPGCRLSKNGTFPVEKSHYYFTDGLISSPELHLLMPVSAPLAATSEAMTTMEAATAMEGSPMETTPAVESMAIVETVPAVEPMTTVEI